MAIDEFGREIPAGSGPGVHPHHHHRAPSSRRSRSRSPGFGGAGIDDVDDDQDRWGSYRRGADDDESRSRRSDGGRRYYYDDDGHEYDGRGRGRDRRSTAAPPVRGRRSSRSRSRSPRSRSRGPPPPPGVGDDSRDGRYRRGDHRPSPPDRSGGRSRRRSSRSPSPRDDRLSHRDDRGGRYHDRDRHGARRRRREDDGDELSDRHPHHHRHRSSSGSRRRRRKAHPVERYVDGPLLCEYLWRREVEEEKERKAVERESRKHDDIYGDLDDVVGGDADKEKKGEGKEEEGGAGEGRTAEEGGADAAAGGDATTAATTTKDEKENRRPAGGDDDANKDNEGGNDKKGADNDGTATNSKRETYNDYNAKYCLHYIRTFFNTHLDDNWFRARYSPLEKKRLIERDSERAASEAVAIRDEAMKSLEEWKASIPKKAEVGGETVAACGFVSGCRLGVGVKPVKGGGTGGGGDPTSTTRKRKLSSGDRDGGDGSAAMASDLDGGANGGGAAASALGDDRPARHHLHSFVRTDASVKIVDVPPHVTDEQLLVALVEHCPHSPPVSVHSSMVIGAGTGGGGGGSGGGGGVVGTAADVVSAEGSGNGQESLHRTAWAVFDGASAKSDFLDELHRANEEANRHHHHHHASDRHVASGRAGGKNLPGALELDVDCTDPYGRREIDADGRGGAPPFASEGAVAGAGTGAGAGGAGTAEETPRPPPRSCTVFVMTAPPLVSQHTAVLSAAVSSVERIPRDREAAAVIARFYDARRSIPEGHRLDDLLELLFPHGDGDHVGGSETEGGEGSEREDEDALDVSIAYLRRVHLFSFYNGCTAAGCVGDVLGELHPAGTIHLRLKGADEMLRRAGQEHEDVTAGHLDRGNDGDDAAAKEGGGGHVNDEEIADQKASAPTPTKDLLVMRLDEIIAKALDRCKLEDRADAPVVDERTDLLAQEIEAAEEKSKEEWIECHGLVDGDGRARCSFHFCRKLFKDKAFLRKHLLKKHPEFLRSEMAKCHDGQMMASWDAEERRPVPPVLIDCGTKFGLVPSVVVGSDRPMASDPEPELWRKEEERRNEQEERIREEERRYRDRIAAEEAASRMDHNGGGTADGGGGGGGGGPPPPVERKRGNFVDVDDMKDEKVELSFEDVDVPAPPKKKKKKKKKLL